MDEEEIVEITLCKMNDTAGPELFFITILVLVYMPRTSVKPVDLPVQTERMKSLEEAIKELYSFLMAGFVMKAVV